MNGEGKKFVVHSDRAVKLESKFIKMSSVSGRNFLANKKHGLFDPFHVQGLFSFSFCKTTNKRVIVQFIFGQCISREKCREQ